jgi:hypothetical protein
MRIIVLSWCTISVENIANMYVTRGRGYLTQVAS